MANGRPNNGANGYRPVLMAVYVIGALLSGAGGNYLWLRNTAPEIVAPDRFTGSQAKALERRIQHLEDEVRSTRADARLATLEAQFVIILANQDRIIQRLDRLNGK